MSKLKVLFCSTTFSSSYHGPAKFAKYLAKHPFKNIEVSILTPDVNEREVDYNIIKLPVYANYYGKLLPFLNFANSFKKFILSNKLDDQFDFIVFNNIIFGTKLVGKVKSKLVGFINDYSSIKPSFKFGSKDYLRRWLFRYLEQKTTKKFNYIIVNSKYLQKLVCQHYKINENKVHLLYKGIDINPALFKSKPINKEKEINILFVKSDYHRGGFFVLLKALQLNPNFSFVLHAVGFELSKKAMQQIQNISNIILQVHGKLSAARVSNLLSEADIFCVPSYSEALGVANVEAMMHGVPVVSTNIGGIPEVSDNGKNAWLVEPGNTKQLAMAIEACILNEDQRNTKVNQAQNFITSQFDINKNLLRFENLLLGLI